jgi:hypothetical protein
MTLAFPLLQLVTDTLFVTKGPVTDHTWALQLLQGIGIALSTWTLARLYEHSRRIQKIETFVGSEDGAGLSAKIDKIESSVARIAETTQSVAISVARIEGRNDTGHGGHAP